MNTLRGAIFFLLKLEVFITQSIIPNQVNLACKSKRRAEYSICLREYTSNGMILGIYPCHYDLNPTRVFTSPLIIHRNLRAYSQTLDATMNICLLLAT